MSSTITPLVASVLLVFSVPSQSQMINHTANSFESVYNIQTVAGMSLDKRALLGGSIFQHKYLVIS